MKNCKELLRLEIYSHIDISIFLINKLERHWHSGIEIIYVLYGSLKIECNNLNIYTLHEDDIYIINSFDIHTLYGSDCKILSLKIDISSLDPEAFSLSQKRFDCNSALEPNKSKFISLKKIIALLVKANVNPDENMNLINKSYIYKILYILASNFKIENETRLKDLNKNTQRIEYILKYVNEHYTEKLSIKSLEDGLFLSTPYISKIFKDFTGFNFKEYITNVRLSHAVTDLQNLNYKIDFIAEKNGFSNTRSFVSAFKKNTTVFQIFIVKT